MPDNANTLYELDLLLSEVSLAERTAGLSRADIATAQARMDGQIIATLNRIGGYDANQHPCCANDCLALPVGDRPKSSRMIHSDRLPMPPTNPATGTPQLSLRKHLGSPT
jgi:hypothetical protein